MMKTMKMLSMLLMVALLSMGFVACGDDKDEVKELESNQELVGNWLSSETYEDALVQELLCFYEDGTFFSQNSEKALSSTDWEAYSKGKYTYHPSNKTISLTVLESWDNEEGYSDATPETFKVEVISISKESLVIKSDVDDLESPDGVSPMITTYKRTDTTSLW